MNVGIDDALLPWCPDVAPIFYHTHRMCLLGRHWNTVMKCRKHDGISGGVVLFIMMIPSFDVFDECRD